MLTSWCCDIRISLSHFGSAKATMDYYYSQIVDLRCMDMDVEIQRETRKGKKRGEKWFTCPWETNRGDGTQKKGRKKRRKNGEREAGRREGKKRPKTHDGQVDAAQESRLRVTVGKHNGWESSNNAQRLSHNAPRGQLLQRARNHRVYPVILLSVLSSSSPSLSRPSLFSVTFSPSKSTNSWNGTPESTLKLGPGARFRRACSAGWIGVKSR